MGKIVLDIETKGEDWEKMDKITQQNLLRWTEREYFSPEEKEHYQENIKKELALSPLTGEIVALGVLDIEKDKGVVYYQNKESAEEKEEQGIKYKPASEKEILKNFWRLAALYEQVITFNGRSFDIPFILARSVVHEIRPTVDLMPYRYASSSEARHLDLLDHLTFFGSLRRKGSLHLWCRAWGIASPKQEEVNGEEVERLFQQGKFLTIAQYNARDLRATKELYLKWKKYYKGPLA